jgi:hypothetical protein
MNETLAPAPPWLEASLVSCIIATSTGAYLAYRAVQAGQVVRPFWSRRGDAPVLAAA